MEIRRYPSDLLLSNMYLIVEGDSALVIDPSRDTGPGDGLTIDRILLTHEHYDHISGVKAWKEKTTAPVLCSRACAENIQSPKKNLARLFDAFCELQTWMVLEEKPDSDMEYACQADEWFQDRMRLDWKGHQIELFEMPGHSGGSIGILLDGAHFFSGDSLMEKHPIELRFPGGSRKQWKETGEPRLAALPEGIHVYPGHFGDFIYHKEKGGCL